MEPRQGELIMQGYVFDILNVLDVFLQNTVL
jgi:hypothetical protein